MSSDIKIQAEPLGVQTMCKFIVDRPIFENKSYWFGNSEATELSPLAKRFFEIPGIVAVLISHNSITLTKASPHPWPALGPHVGNAIRAHVTSGDATVDQSLVDNLPSPDDIRRRVQDVITQEIAPSVAEHGGTVRVVDVKSNVVMLELGGGCQGCSSATATLKYGVEAAIRRAVPEVGEIVDTTDHASGDNPYL
jgi:Fe-S cluster biogenesis protein NfuA